MMISQEEEVPTINGYVVAAPHGDEIRYWCDECQRYHWHTWAKNEDGLRSAHCPFQKARGVRWIKLVPVGRVSPRFFNREPAEGGVRTHIVRGPDGRETEIIVGPGYTFSR